MKIEKLELKGYTIIGSTISLITDKINEIIDVVNEVVKEKDGIIEILVMLKDLSHKHV